MGMNIVLIEPEIPQNTGNIARTCALTNTKLHLIKPLGFSVENKYLKRAGLDYWDLVDITYYENIDEFFCINKNKNFYYATTKADKNYSDITYKDGDFFIFGKETKGLPESLLKKNKESLIKIPIKESLKRSLNLANSVNIILYEGLRQIGFKF